MNCRPTSEPVIFLYQCVVYAYYYTIPQLVLHKLCVRSGYEDESGGNATSLCRRHDNSSSKSSKDFIYKGVIMIYQNMYLVSTKKVLVPIIYRNKSLSPISHRKKFLSPHFWSEKELWFPIFIFNFSFFWSILIINIQNYEIMGNEKTSFYLDSQFERGGGGKPV